MPYEIEASRVETDTNVRRDGAPSERTHETVWTGTLPFEALKAIVCDALSSALGAPAHGVRLEDLQLHAGAWPAADFRLVHDHLWWEKPDAG